MAKNITNTKSNKLISGTSGNDTLYNGTGYSNRGGNRVTINGGAGNDYIDNWYGSYVSLVGGKGNDDISNYSGEKATISGGAGADFIWNGSDSDETSINGGNDDDGIYNHAEEVTITGGKGNDRIYLENDSSETLIKHFSGDGNDTIRGFNSTSTLSVSGSYSTQVSGYDVLVKSGSSTITLKNVYVSADKININGKSTTLERKTIKLTSDNNDVTIFRDSISVVGSAQGDWIGNYGEHVTIDAGKGDDYISIWEDDNTITGGKGNDTIHLGYDVSDNVIQYKSGDGNDIIYGFKENSTLSIGGGSYSTKKSGSDVIVTVGKGKITLEGAASLSKLNIKKTSGDSSSSGGDSSSSTTKTVTNSTKSPVTVSSSIKNIISASRTKSVKITGNSLANSIVGGSKNDILYGKAGNDTILGGKGSDKIYGGAGNDYIYGGDGNDTLKGGKDNDKLWGNDDDNVFIYENGDGKDTIYGFDDDDMLKITGSFSASYNSSKKEIYFKVGNISNAITLKNYDTSTFNVNGSNYRISGSKLVKR